MPEQTTAIPVNVVTGFLGSGKTTLLQRLLASPALADTAVLVNEFGEVGLDHHLLRRLGDEIVLLQSGCLCCTIRGDLSAAMRDLYSRRERGEIPAFRRLAVETTGLADPVPILSTVMAEPVLRHHFRLGNVVTTVDAVNGLLHLERQEESAKQAAVADRIVITKTDIADARDIAELRRRLTRLNPAAPQLETAPACELDPDLILTRDLYDLDGRAEEVRRWLAVEGGQAQAAAADHHHHDVNRHDARIHAFCLRFERPLDWTAFGIWLTMLLHAHGTDILRVKGMLNVDGSPGPVVIHGVQHLVHPPDHLPQWPDDDHSSRIVFIVRGLSRELIERSLAAFARLGTPVAEAV
ncbi:MAG TPA: GTP-binding protein [Xanthobacteraceae bacterium]|nr:GTP-binding protein [Xanthobacteraceae bacterium]